MAPKGTAAAIYCRISDDREGRELGVQRQEEDCRALAAREGLTVAEVYTDNDIGASTRTRKGKRRPRFDAMLAAAESGRFGAIVAYSNSRLTRRPMELEALIRLHERTGVRVVTVASGEDNLATADGRMVARIKGNIDAGEAERLAERLARAHLQAAQQGRTVGGTRPFGWKRGDRFREVDPVEAALIQEAADAVLDGVPVARIVADWNARGIVTPNGNPWNRRVLDRLLRSPRLAGWRIYKGEIATDRDGNPVRGDFTPILDQSTHDRVVAALSRPDNRVRRPRRGARHYLLSAIARCGICAAPMYGARRPYKSGGETVEAHYYVCTGQSPQPHVLSASGRALDLLVCDTMAADLARRRIVPAAPEPFAGDARIEQIGEQVGELMAAYRSGQLSSALVFGQVSELEAERDSLKAARRGYEAELRAAEPEPVEVTPDGFLGLDVDRQRAVIERRLEAVVIAPTTRVTGNRFDPDRVSFVWRER